jgi:hypothetical protein
VVAPNISACILESTETVAVVYFGDSHEMIATCGRRGGQQPMSRRNREQTMFHLRTPYWFIATFLGMVAMLSGQESVTDILGKEGLDMGDPGQRAESVRQMRAILDQRHQAARARAPGMGWPLREEHANGQVIELMGADGDVPVYFMTHNANAAISTGANLLQASPYQVDGAGLTVGEWDAGSARTTHQELTGRVTIMNGGAALVDHSTHVCGTIAASGVQAAAKGMAPAIRVDSYDWTSDYSEMTGRGASYPGEAGKIYLSNHSYGQIKGWYYNGGSPTWYWYGTGTTPAASDTSFGRYDTYANQTDAIAVSLPYYLIVRSAGNDRADNPTTGDTVCLSSSGTNFVSYDPASHPPGDGTYKNGYDTISADAVAKDMLTVGSVTDAVSGGVRSVSASAMSYYSSWGPTDDGRIKPDLVANGDGLYSCISTSDTAYATYSGTSMASPNATGTAALLVHWWGKLFPGHAMRASTLKALLIHTADDMGTPGPDYVYGWGLINAKAAADLIQAYKNSPGTRRVTEDRITSSSGWKTYTFTWDGVSPIRATLCWTDPVGTAQTGDNIRTPSLVNDLDLSITGPTGTQYLPWVMPYVGDWTNAKLSANATTGVNHTDDVEQVFVSNPSAAGSYTVTVSFTGTLTGGAQNFSLVLGGGVASAAAAAPAASALSPSSGTPSALTLTLAGSNYLLGADVKFTKSGQSDVPATGQEITPGSAKVRLDATSMNPGYWNAVITNPDGQSAISANALLLQGAPSISSFSPTYGLAGDQVTIAGSNFLGASSVMIHGVSTTFTVDSASQITATVPVSAGTGTISVTTPSGTATSAGNYTSFGGNGTPVISSFSPGGGLAGSSVVITGSNFAGVTAVSINGVSVTTFSVDSFTQITATIPSGATSGVISVANGYGMGTSASSFFLLSIIWQNNLEAGSSGWTHSASTGTIDNWALTTAKSHSTSHSFFAAGPSTKNVDDLYSPAVAIPASASGIQLGFWHNYNMQNRYDGGVLELSVDGGTWFDVTAIGSGAAFASGGYANTLISSSSPFRNRLAWTGTNSGFTQVVINLTDLTKYAGHNLAMRWRLATNSSTASTGWYIDDIVLSAIIPPNQAPTISVAAVATLSTVTGTSTQLSVTAADDGGEPALTYTWAATGGPPGRAVIFSANGTNAAKSSAATFAAAGSYTLTVTVTDGGGLATTSSVNVTVAQANTSIAVTPATASVTIGFSVGFAAGVSDQFGDLMSPQPTVAWSASGGGTIDSGGLFSAVTAGGPYSITASSGSASGGASVSVSKATATVTLGNLAQTYDGSPKPESAITNPTGLAIAFTYGGSATVPADAGSYAVIGTIQDADYQGSASGTLVISKAAQSIEFGAPAAKMYGDAPFALGGVASSGLPVSYASSDEAVATVSGNVVTIAGVGSTTITASQAGDANHGAAENVSQILTVVPSYFSWASDNNLPSASAGMSQDADGDGLCNLLEYALNTDPMRPNASPLACDLESVGGRDYLRLTIPKNPAAADVTYAVEVCGDLAAGSWSAADTVVEEDGAGRLVVRDKIPVGDAQRRFMRLKVSVAR